MVKRRRHTRLVEQVVRLNPKEERALARECFLGDVAITHQAVLSHLLKKLGFRQGYEKELDKLRASRLVQQALEDAKRGRLVKAKEDFSKHVCGNGD